MIRDTLSIPEFRLDQGAVDALQKFLASREGQKLVKVLRGAHPLTALANSQSGAKEIRDASIVEGSSPGIRDNLLGKIQGYELCLKVFDDLTAERANPAPVDRQTTRVAKSLRTPANDL